MPHAKTSPNTNTLIQINLNFLLLKVECHPKISAVAKAAASGAVIAEEIPAAKKPNDTKDEDQLPSKGFN